MFAGLTVILSFFFWFRYRARSEMQQTIRAAIDKGQELTPELVESLGKPAKPSKDKDLRYALIWIAVAIGFGAMGGAIGAVAVATHHEFVLAIIGEIGTAGGTGYVIEYCGEAIRDLSMEGRMTVCNMAIEGGARCGYVNPDETTFEYLRGRPHAPTGDAWEAAVADWSTLHSDDDAVWDKEVVLDAATIRPHVTWGTNPGQVAPIDSAVPSPDDYDNPTTKETVARALESREMTVVVDSFLTDTARCATVVLPTTTMLEDDDLVGAYGHHWLGNVRPVVAAPDGAWSSICCRCSSSGARPAFVGPRRSGWGSCSRSDWPCSWCTWSWRRSSSRCYTHLSSC